MIGITGYSIACLAEILERSSVKIDTVLSYSRFTLMDSSLLSLLPQLTSKQVTGGRESLQAERRERVSAKT